MDGDKKNDDTKKTHNHLDYAELKTRTYHAIVPCNLHKLGRAYSLTLAKKTLIEFGISFAWN